MVFDLSTVGTVTAALLAAAIVSLITTPVVRTLAIRIGAVDVPKDGRRMHNHPIPRMGGLAIFFGFLLSTLVFLPLTRPLRGMLMGAVIIVILGIFDDIYALGAKLKLVVQICAALIAVLMGNEITLLSNPNIFSSNPFWELGWLAIPVSVVWIVGITNAVNLIDGLDGLACGVSTISSMTLLVIALTVAEPSIAILTAALAGGCLGFLPYNLNPAKIFMGDTGSTFLGFVLAAVSIQGLFKLYAIMSFAVPFLVLALRHLLCHPSPGVPRAVPHDSRPGTYPPPADRHGLFPEAGRGRAVCDLRHSGPVCRGAGHQRRAEGHGISSGPLPVRSHGRQGLFRPRQ